MMQISGKNLRLKKLSDREQAIYNLICENKHLTVEQVRAEFDISRATVLETMLR